MIIRYFHGKSIDQGSEGKQRMTSLSEIAGRDVELFRGSNLPAEFAATLTEVPAVNPDLEKLDSVLYFVHVSPLEEWKKGALKSAIVGSTGALSRLFVVLVSGGGLNLTDPYCVDCCAASRVRGFGGMAIWSHPFDPRSDDFSAFWNRVCGLFISPGESKPTFEEFENLVNPLNRSSTDRENDPTQENALSILAQVVKGAGKQVSESNKGVIHVVDRWQGGAVGDFAVVKRGVGRLAELGGIFERQRGRIEAFCRDLLEPERNLSQELLTSLLVDLARLGEVAGDIRNGVSWLGMEDVIDGKGADTFDIAGLEALRDEIKEVGTNPSSDLQSNAELEEAIRNLIRWLSERRIS